MKTFSIVGQKFRGLDPYLPGILPGTKVVLMREPDNKFDKNAVMVLIDGHHVGYLSSKQNADVARAIDQNGRLAVRSDYVYGQAADSNIEIRRAIDAKFARSPNSSYPMVEVEI
jgi:hypothetical protein